VYHIILYEGAKMYVTASEVGEFTGIAYTDMKVDGETMTEAQWKQFVTVYQVPIADMIHRYCRVVTFDPTAANAIVTEYKSGRGNTSDELPYVRGGTSIYGSGEWLPNDVEFYLKHLYFTGKINNVLKAPVIVEEDTADKLSVPSWNKRTQRSMSVAGDYEVYTEDELTMVRFHNNIPRKGMQNVRFTYYTGYDPASDAFKAIKLQVLRCFKNFVMLKKKTQEPFAIRAHGVRDFQTMFDPFDESHILGDLERMALEPYRRFPIPGDMFA
jgi:hypothetical protein